MDTGEETARIELVADRREFLTRLLDRPADKPTLVDDLDASRSTVDRAIRELERADLVDRVDGEYVATTLGELAVERYRAFVDDQRAIFAADGALAALPPAADLPAELLTEGEVSAAPDEPYRLYERLLADVRTADAVDALLPRLGDTRPLRLCRARLLDGDLSGGVVAAPDVADRLREEFPALAADLGSRSGFDLRRGEVPPFELFVVREGDRRTVFVLTADGGDAVGLVRSTADAVVDWAEGVLAAVGATATPVDVSVPDDAAATALAEASDPLRADGFERFDERAFAGRTPTDPVRAWQTGHGLADVYYGYAFQRRTRPDDGDGRPVAAALADRLGAGDDVVVTGPPGDGKSTTCRSVACRWVRRDRGPVFYRPARAGESFDAPERVAAAADCDGRALVVVENATGKRGEAALELCRLLDGDAAVLLEARDGDWRGLAESLSDATLREVLRSGVDEFRLPALDAAACERAVEAFEAATGRRVAVDPERLLERVNRGDAGGMYFLSYHLVAHSGGAPWRRGEDAPTGLDADVREAHDALGDAGDGGTALAVGALAAALVAADRAVTAGQIHAVAAGRVADGDADPVDAHRRIADALDALTGRLLFPADDGYRTQHPYWAVQFLETLLDREERRAVAAFERGLSALFAAADDRARRDRVERWLGGEATTLRRTADDPDGLVRSVFDLATDHSSLVPLFGDHTRSGIALPEGCTPETTLACLRDRMVGWYEHGDLDRAESVAEALAERARDVDADAATRDRFVVRSLVNRGEVAEQRGDMTTARERFERALDRASAADDDRLRVMARNSLAWVALQTDRFDDAEAHLDAALSTGEDLPPMPERATTTNYRASLARRRGDLDRAEEWLRRTLSMDRQLGDDGDVAHTLNELGIVTENQGEFDRAADYYRRCIERRRETGNRRALAKNVYNLGDLLAKRGDVTGAEDCLERALSLADELGMDRFRGNVHAGFGRVALERGDLEAAADHYRRNREIHRDHDHDVGAAQAVVKLGDVARERADAGTALDRYDRAAATLSDLDAVGMAVKTLERRVDLLVDEGRRDAAAVCCERAADLAADAGLDDRGEEFRERRADLLAAADD
ncbi:tetratricopeptide repeat protein [Halostella litorea]|uniref:tetratricopeptide repeat protein n=1 Tax=Halostella litorea TaxID=2528831 RepID=UPI00109206A9|nr:tetratricopeptide repeat protein [Halostella litorea]